MTLGPLVTVSDSMVVWAFRYCLGRRTYAVSDCVENILAVWPSLSDKTRELIHREALKAIENDQAGMDMDKKEWQKVINRWNKDHI